MNDTKITQEKIFHVVSTSELMKSLQELSKVFINSFENEAFCTLQKHVKEAGKPQLEFSKEFQKELKRLGRTFKKSLQFQATSTKEFTESISSRLQNFLYAVQEVEDYPIEKISDTLEHIFEKEDLASFSVKSFMKKFKKALINIMIKHYISNEEATFDLLLEHELKNLKVDYLIQNNALRYLEPHKYKQYLFYLNKGFNALYQDMKAYTDFSNPFFAAADKLFQNIIVKLNQAAGIESPEIEAPTPAIIESETNNYPTHIFRSLQDFRLFNELMKTNTTADEIGFVFRTMSEQENPTSIVVKETTFRNWFNQESGHPTELNNPIKTLSRIKDRLKKETIYSLQKKLLKTKAIQLN